MEPFAYKNGINFYKDGHNYALASLIYYTASTSWGVKNFEDLLFYYQNASRVKSNFSISQLAIHAQKLQGKELFEYLFPISIEDIDCINEIKIGKNNNDISFIILFGLISHLEKYITNSYQIIHDTSKNLVTYNDHIKAFLNIEEDIEFKLTNVTNIRFPLKLVGVEQRDSKSSYGVQLADILVGGIVEHFWALKGLISQTEYNENLIELYSEINLLHMLPSINFVEDQMFRENSQGAELIDFISEKFNNS